MEWLNYHHLFYFWVVARKGSITEASKELRLAHPTISEQIHELEDQLDELTARIVTDGLASSSGSIEVFGDGSGVPDQSAHAPLQAPLSQNLVCDPLLLHLLGERLRVLELVEQHDADDLEALRLVLGVEIDEAERRGVV